MKKYINVSISLLLLLVNISTAQLATLKTIHKKNSNIVADVVLEGIQISSESVNSSGDKKISCFFIFKDRPTSYFYEINTKKNELIFQFNDAKQGYSPIQSVSNGPIKGFTITEEKVDINSSVVGLLPEWHNVLSVTFKLSTVPKITVNDKYSVVSFSFNWSTDPKKNKKNIVDKNKKRRRGVVIAGSIGAVIAGGSVALVHLTKNDSDNISGGDIDNSDLPVRPPVQ